MKKSLFALAVLGAFAGAASAQTSVTIYGVVDVGVSRTDTNVTEPIWGLTSGQQNGSRIGFRGTEDLGGGLKANFVLENGFNIDNGTLGQGNRIFGRQAWVGLSGGFGAVKFGRQLTPIFVAQDTIDPFGTGITYGEGGMASLFNNGGIRMDNTVNYSFSAAGISGEVAYGFGEQAGESRGNRQIGAGLSYVNGPITVVAAFHRADASAIPAVASVVPVAGVDHLRTTLIGGAFDFRVAKLHAAFADNRAAVITGGDAKRRDYMLGVSAPIGAAGTVLAQYIRNDARDSAALVDADSWGLGYTHSLSKRTNLYTSYSITKPDTVADTDVSWFNVGIRHRF